jgi:DNA-binding PadR family transcriptional regulator
MANTALTQVQMLYLQALKDGPKASSDLMKMVRDRLTELKGGNNPVGATARSQGVMQELEDDGYIVKVGGSFFGGKKYDLTDKGREAAG